MPCGAEVQWERSRDLDVPVNRGARNREAEEGGDDEANQVVKRRGGGAPLIAVRTFGSSNPLRFQGQNLACLRASGESNYFMDFVRLRLRAKRAKSKPGAL